MIRLAISAAGRIEEEFVKRGDQALASRCSAAKGAVLSGAEALARRKSPRGIRVDAVAPDPVDASLLRGHAREFGKTVFERGKAKTGWPRPPKRRPASLFCRRRTRTA